VQADLEFFVVEKDSAWTSDGNSYKFRMRDTTLAPTGLRVQRLRCPPSLSARSPVTNEASGTVGDTIAGVYTEQEVQEFKYKDTAMGDDSSFQGYPAGEGCVAAPIDSTEPTWLGWLRAFSHTSVTGAAYYTDTESHALDTLDTYNDTWSYLSFYITNVNPAYTIPLSGSWPAGGGQVSNAADSISFNGSVRQGSDFNNNLPDAIVTVHWHNDATDQSGTFAVDDNPGEWSGTVPLEYANDPADDPITNVLTFHAEAQSIRSGLPVSEVTTVTVINYPIPEPVAALAAVGLVLLGCCRRCG
jgi:hypothetical protein